MAQIGRVVVNYQNYYPVPLRAPWAGVSRSIEVPRREAFWKVLTTCDDLHIFFDEMIGHLPSLSASPPHGYFYVSLV